MSRATIYRHGQSFANINGFALEGREERLTRKGVDQATGLGAELALGRQEVATSTFRRAKETALYAGFVCVEYTLLDEIQTESSRQEILRDAMRGILPYEVHQRANDILENPPDQEIWITHALVIAGLRYEQEEGLKGRELISRYCESTVIEI